MAKLSTAVSEFIGNVFGKQQKLRTDLSLTKGEFLGYEKYGLGASGMGYVSIGNITQDMRLDQRRLYRYADYEEMDDYPDISGAVDIYSDDSTQVDSSMRRSVWIESNNEKIKSELDFMLQKKLNIEDEIWGLARGLTMYGDDFEEILVSDNGVEGINYLPSPTVQRVEDKSSTLLGFVQTFNPNLIYTPEQFEALRTQVDQTSADVFFEDWRVVHFRLRSKKRASLYGFGIGEPVRWVWKRLMLLEDSVLVYRLTRSPSRYAFYIDLGTMSKEDGERALEEAKQRLKKQKFINPRTGKPDFRYNPLSLDEDFFLGVRDGKETARVDVLSGPSYQHVDDVNYFLYKLYAGLKVPRAYLGYDENLQSRATLSSEDIRFAKTVLRIQRELRNGLKKICNVHLAAKKIDPTSVNFDVVMTPPSSIFELGQMEVRNARATLASMMQAHVSLHWLLSRVYGLSDTEIKTIMKERNEEAKQSAEAGGGGGFESVGYKHRGKILFDSPKSIGNFEMVPISEEMLMRGNRIDEKRVESLIVNALNDPRSNVGRHLRETGRLLKEIAYSTRSGAR